LRVDIFDTDKKYNIIYADPPWNFSSKELQKYNGNRFRPLEEVYNTEKTATMCEWDVGRIADTDCALFMWTTDAHIEEALNLMKKWGFKYVTVAFIWSKVTKNGKQVSNLGAWTMKNCEICLFGTKGRMLKYKKSNSVKQLFEAERTAHSKKPDCVRDFIVELFGDIPRIELFARQHADGWDCWGNEV
jgi:site-specific DNA-methyltransferase (adenine-specific)